MTRGADECRGTSVTSRFDVVSFGVAHECVLSRAAIEISYPFETSGPATIDLSVAARPLIVGSDEDAYAYHPALTTQWLCAPPDWPATRDVRELEQVFESFVWPNQANSCRPPPGESDIGCLYFNGYEGFDVLTISCLHRGNFQFELRLEGVTELGSQVRIEALAALEKIESSARDIGAPPLAAEDIAAARAAAKSRVALPSVPARALADFTSRFDPAPFDFVASYNLNTGWFTLTATPRPAATHLSAGSPQSNLKRM